MACGRKTISHEKKKNREGIQGRYYDVKKKNVFPNSMESIGVTSDYTKDYTENKILKII